MGMNGTFEQLKRMADGPVSGKRVEDDLRWNARKLWRRQQ